MKWLSGPLARVFMDSVSRHREQGDLPLFLVKVVAILVVAGFLSYSVERFCKKRGWTGERTKASLQRSRKKTGHIVNLAANFVAKVVFTVLAAAVVFYALWALVAFPISGEFTTSPGNIALMVFFLGVAVGGLWFLRKLWSKGPPSEQGDSTELGAGQNKEDGQ